MFVLIWSLVADETEHLVGPFPTREDAESWANKYIVLHDTCHNVVKMSPPAQYPGVKSSKHSDYDIALAYDMSELESDIKAAMVGVVPLIGR